MDSRALTARTGNERDVLLAFLADHRQLIRTTVSALGDEEARRRLVPSLTTPLGLLKHVTFVETVWFVCYFHGLSRAEAGIPETVDESYAVDPSDTVADVARHHELAVARSDSIIAGLELDRTCAHPLMGELSLRWVLTHCIRELAQHAGHAEILVEQIRADRPTG